MGSVECSRSSFERRTPHKGLVFIVAFAAVLAVLLCVPQTAHAASKIVVNGTTYATPIQQGSWTWDGSNLLVLEGSDKKENAPRIDSILGYGDLRVVVKGHYKIGIGAAEAASLGVQPVRTAIRMVNAGNLSVENYDGTGYLHLCSTDEGIVVDDGDLKCAATDIEVEVSSTTQKNNQFGIKVQQGNFEATGGANHELRVSVSAGLGALPAKAYGVYVGAALGKGGKAQVDTRVTAFVCAQGNASGFHVSADNSHASSKADTSDATLWVGDEGFVGAFATGAAGSGVADGTRGVFVSAMDGGDASLYCNGELSCSAMSTSGIDSYINDINGLFGIGVFGIDGGNAGLYLGSDSTVSAMGDSAPIFVVNKGARASAPTVDCSVPAVGYLDSTRAYATARPCEYYRAEDGVTFFGSIFLTGSGGIAYLGDRETPSSVLIGSDNTNYLLRLYGDERLDTMSAIVTEAFPEALPEGTPVIIASGWGYADALAASALAGGLEAPVILTSPYELSDEAIEQIIRLDAKYAIIVGGTAAVSADVESQLEELIGASSVERVYGATRMDTAQEIFHYGERNISGGWGSTAIVATAWNYADALSASSFAYWMCAPIILADPQGLSDDQVSVLKNGGFDKVLVLGGSAAVPDSVYASIEAAAGSSASVYRFAGEARVQTSLDLAGFAIDHGFLSMDDVVFATAWNYPDALAASSLAGKNAAALILVDDKTPVLYDYLAGYKGYVDQGYVVGGTSAVSEDIRRALASTLGLKVG